MGAVPAAAPSVKGPAKGAAKSKGGGQFSGPLYNPSQTLTGKALDTAAGQIADAQTKGPITELAKQIATNNASNAQGQKTDFGYYMQLAQDAKNSVAQEQQIGAGLNSTLAGIGNQTQAQLGQIGQQQQGGAVGRMSALGLGGDASASLSAAQAQQQGVAAQNSQTFRDQGATQGANYGSTGAQIGAAVPLAGTSAISQLAKQGQLANEPLNSKIAAEDASRGALKATALGQLRTAERNYQIAQEGIGVKTQALQTTAAQDQAKNLLTERGQNITQGDNAARLAQQNLDSLRTTNTSAANNQANNSTRVLLQQMKNSAAKGKRATGAAANAVFSHIDYVTGEIQNLVNNGLSPVAAYHLLQNGGRVQTGTSSTGKPTYRTYYPNRLGTQVLNAAYNVRSGGSGLTSGDEAWLASLGIINPTRYARSKGPAKSKTPKQAVQGVLG